MTIKHRDFGTLCGSYGKGVDGSLTINFGVSGGKNCDVSCPLHPANGGGCYAVTAGARKPSITVNLERKENRFSEMLVALVANIEKIASAPWVRFSTFGSIPAPSSWTSEDRANLATIASALDHGKVHFPVETIEKAEALKALGFFPRVSMGHADKAREAGLPVSIVVNGAKTITGSMTRARKHEVSKPARDVAKASNGSAKVCPAIIGNAKCGACTRCGANGPATIIYPRHV